MDELLCRRRSAPSSIIDCTKFVHNQTMATSKKAALALSLVAVCGTIAFFNIPSTNNSNPVIESLPPISMASSLQYLLRVVMQYMKNIYWSS